MNDTAQFMLDHLTHEPNDIPSTCPTNMAHTDLFSIVILLIFFILGAPVNVYIFQQMHACLSSPSDGEWTPNDNLRYPRNSMGIPRSFRILQKHLNISDLLVIFVYIPSKICWNLMKTWRGGWQLCSLVNGANVLAFHISSNIIVCIAIDKTLKPHLRQDGQIANKMVLVAWLLALVFSLPSFFLWTTLDNGHGKVMCCTREIKESFEQAVKAYYFIHLMAIFWAPAVIICIAYATLLVGLYSMSNISFIRESLCVIWNGSSNTPRPEITERFIENKLPEPPVSKPVRLKPSLVQTPKSIVKIHNTSENEYTNQSFKEELEFCNSTDVSSSSNTFSAVSNNNQPLQQPPSEGNLSAATGPAVVISCSGRSVTSHKSVSFTGAPVTTRFNKRHSSSASSSQSAANRAFGLSLMLVLTYVICWLPYGVISVIGRNAPLWTAYLQHLMVFNSVINPFLYGFRLPRFSMKRMKSKFRAICCGFV